ncbi:MAG: ABC-three component system middle component 1 [bacterium]
MKQLIEKLAIDYGLNVEPVGSEQLDMLFAYYEDKNDFFLFVIENMVDLHEKLKTNDNKQELEHAINNLVYTLLQTEDFLKFKERFIEHNISIVIVVSGVVKEEEIGLFKIEENVYTSKKYVLHYDKDNLNVLLSKIGNIEDVKTLDLVLSNLVKSNSDLLKDTNSEGKWYELLLRLFIKIPFLNYNKTDIGSEELVAIEETISNSLTDEQRKLISEIHKIDIKKIDAIETHILQKYQL